MRELRTAHEVVETLGGPAATGKLTGVSPQAAWNWKQTNKLPTDTFLVIRAALETKGATAPASLWGMKEPEQAG